MFSSEWKIVFIVLDVCPWLDIMTNRTYITDVSGNWTISQDCLGESITIVDVKCLTNGTWS